MTERERFEVWAHPQDFDQRIKAPSKYNNYEVQAAWEAWQERAAQPVPSVPDTYAAGINAVAAMLQSKADEYAKEYGHDDMGGLSFGPGMGGEIKMDYYTNLIELVDDVRAMLEAAPEAK